MFVIRERLYAHPVHPKPCRLLLKRHGTCAETRFHLSPKQTLPFKSTGASVQSTASSRVVSISGSNVGYTTFRGSVRVLATHSIRQFPLHFPSRASPCAIRFQTHSTSLLLLLRMGTNPFLKKLCSLFECTMTDKRRYVVILNVNTSLSESFTNDYH